MATERYLEEKQDGRRLPNGALRLKRLKPKHFRIIKMHLEGHPSSLIATTEGMTDATVSRILRDPLAQEVIQAAGATRDMEFEALYGRHLDALRSGFDSGDVRDQLRAASVYGRERSERAKANAGASTETAEDVIQRILTQVNVQVNVGGES